MNKLKWIFLAVLLVFSLIIVFQNIEATEIRLLTWSFQLPQAALLLGTLGVGYIMGLLTPTLRKVATWRSRSKKTPAEFSKPEIPENSV